MQDSNYQFLYFNFFFFRENDKQLEIGDVDDRIKEIKPDPEEQKRSERLQEFFKKIAGEDLEVDWMELKQILDYALKNGMRIFLLSSYITQGCLYLKLRHSSSLV